MRVMFHFQTMKSAEDVATLQKSFWDDAKARLDLKDLELNILKEDLLQKDGIIAENKVSLFHLLP